MRQAVIQKAEEKQRRQQPNLTGIPTQMKMDFEQRSGLSFDDVRVHYNSDKPRKIGALAYTQGTQVHIGPGQERHLRHELGHVVQQKQGIVRPDTQHFSGLDMNTDAKLEYEADLIGHSDMHFAKEQNSKQFQMPVIQAAGYLTNIVASSRDLAAAKDSLNTADWVRRLSEKSELPVVMIFESMGISKETYNHVHDETIRCPMNTILIFGLNTKMERDGDVSKLQNTISELNTEPKEYGDFYHLFFPFWFTWKTPPQMKKTEYEMPFVDARLTIMKVAKDVVDLIGDMRQKAHFMFRWFDGDATDVSPFDTSEEKTMLQHMAGIKTPVFVTGRYDWKSTKTDGKYAEFVSKINEDEKELRKEYFVLLRQLFPPPEKSVPRAAATAVEPAVVPRAAVTAAEPAVVPRAAVTAAEPAVVPRAAATAAEPAVVPRAAATAAEPAVVPRAAATAEPVVAPLAMIPKAILLQNNGLSRNLRFYLPEPLFMMNEAAHRALLGLKMGDVPNQSRESEKLFWENLRLRQAVALFPWIENFSVEKPIKQEFVLPLEKESAMATKSSVRPNGKKSVPSSGTSQAQVAPAPIKNSYWQNMLEFFAGNGDKTLTNFRSALAHLRQSAFGSSDWKFVLKPPVWYNSMSITLPEDERSVTSENLAQMKLDKKRLDLSGNRWVYLNEDVEDVEADEAVEKIGKREKRVKTKRIEFIESDIQSFLTKR